MLCNFVLCVCVLTLSKNNTCVILTVRELLPVSFVNAVNTYSSSGFYSPPERTNRSGNSVQAPTHSFSLSYTRMNIYSYTHTITTTPPPPPLSPPLLPPLSPPPPFYTVKRPAATRVRSMFSVCLPSSCADTSILLLCVFTVSPAQQPLQTTLGTNVFTVVHPDLQGINSFVSNLACGNQCGKTKEHIRELRLYHCVLAGW